MATYVYTCPHGQSHVNAPMQEGPPAEAPFCPVCDAPQKRVWSFGLNNIVELRRERERGGMSAVRDLFLPTAKELAGPGDPDGSKAIREWNDTHEPKVGNKRPMRPEAPKAVF